MKERQQNHRSVLQRMLLVSLPLVVLPTASVLAISLACYREWLTEQARDEQIRIATNVASSLERSLKSKMDILKTLTAEWDSPDKIHLAGLLEKIGASQITVLKAPGLASGKPDEVVARYPADALNPVMPVNTDFGSPDEDDAKMTRPMDVRGPTFSIAFYVHVEKMSTEVGHYLLATVPIRLLSMPAGPNLVAILPEFQVRRDPVLVRTDGASQRDQIEAEKLASLQRFSSNSEVETLADELHQIVYVDLNVIPGRVASAQSYTSIYRPWWRALSLSIFGLGLVTAGGCFILIREARSLQLPLGEITAALHSFSLGHQSVRVPVRDLFEVAQLGAAFNRLGDSVQNTHLRMRVLNKTIMDLFACNDIDGLLRKSTELVCTQCQADIAWFIRKQGNTGWVWRNHRSTELSKAEIEALPQAGGAQRVFHFALKGTSSEIGILTAVYNETPSETIDSTLHAVISLVETSLSKFESLNYTALVNSEQDLAVAVRRDIDSERLELSGPERVAHYYWPSRRLGGDWIFLSEDKKTGALYLVLGDVDGHGLAQGVVATAVKGALDVIEQLMSAGSGSGDWSPAQIMGLLEGAVRRVVAIGDLRITCMVARIDFVGAKLSLCNAGHTAPLLVQHGSEGNTVQHLDRDAQPSFFTAKPAAGPGRFLQVEYKLNPGDTLVLYTDGLSKAKNLKSGIFGRFLERGLKQHRTFSKATELRDEILAMFRYYTQDTSLDDDVCFLVVQLQSEDGVDQSSVA